MKRVASWAVKLVDWVSGGQLWLAGLFMFFIILVIVQGVFMRRVLHDPQAYSHELSRYSMLPLVVFALAFTQKLKGHVAVDILLYRLRGKVKNACLLFSYILFLAYTLALLFASWQKTSVFWGSRMTTEEIMLPMWAISGLMLLGLGALILQIIVDIVRSIAAFRGRAQEISGASPE